MASPGPPPSKKPEKPGLTIIHGNALFASYARNRRSVMGAEFFAANLKPGDCWKLVHPPILEIGKRS